MNSSHLNNAYPRLVRRIQGACIDSIIVAIAAIGMLVLVDAMGESAAVKMICAALTILLLEPFAVAFTGGTIGHHVLGMRVRRKSEDKRLHIVAALVRFVVKTLFGLPSFFVALITRNRQALHDLSANSLVIHKSVVGLPVYEILSEVTREDEQRAYVSMWSRLLVIFLYWVLSYLVFGMFALFVSSECRQNGICSSADDLWIMAILTMTLISFVGTAILGWRGILFGCRKQAMPSN